MAVRELAARSAEARAGTAERVADRLRGMLREGGGQERGTDGVMQQQALACALSMVRAELRSVEVRQGGESKAPATTGISYGNILVMATY